jgi:hypothetical protein
MIQKSAIEKVQAMIDGKTMNGQGFSTEEAFQIMEAFPGQVEILDPEVMTKKEISEQYTRITGRSLDEDILNDSGPEIFIPEELVNPAPQGIDNA